MTSATEGPNAKQIVETMIARLREMQATGESEVIGRRIVAGAGLAGGGTLAEDVTIGLSQASQNAISRADRSVSDASLAETLEGYVTAEDHVAALGDYLPRADAYRVIVLPFSHPGTVTGTVTAPPILPTGPGTIESVSVAVAEPGAELTVVVAGRSFVVPAGQKARSFTHGGPVTTSTPLSLSLVSTGVRGVTVSVRVREEV